jgi:hypothetical protein
MAAYTPGPWRIDEKDESTWRILGPREDGHWSNEIAELSYTGGNAEANAHLIESSPALLEALQAILEQVAIDEETDRFSTELEFRHEKAREAIAKALGQPASREQEAGR